MISYLLSFFITPTFENSNSLDNRKSKADKIIQKYPDKVPMIVRKSTNTQNTISDYPYKNLPKEKYAVNKHFTVKEFKDKLIKDLCLNQSNMLFLECNGKLLSDQQLVENIYDVNKDEDNFLKIYYFYY